MVLGPQMWLPIVAQSQHGSSSWHGTLVVGATVVDGAGAVVVDGGMVVGGAAIVVGGTVGAGGHVTDPLCWSSTWPVAELVIVTVHTYERCPPMLSW